jgi:hypothetical protein
MFQRIFALVAKHSRERHFRSAKRHRAALARPLQARTQSYANPFSHKCAEPQATTEVSRRTVSSALSLCVPTSVLISKAFSMQRVSHGIPPIDHNTPCKNYRTASFACVRSLPLIHVEICLMPLRDDRDIVV